MLNAFKKPRTLRYTALFAAMIVAGMLTLLSLSLRNQDRAAQGKVDASLQQLAGLLQDVADHQDGGALPGLVRGWVRTEPGVVRVQVRRGDGTVLADADRPSDPAVRTRHDVALVGATVGPARMLVEFDGSEAVAERARIVREYAIEAGALLLLLWALAVLATARLATARRYRVLLATSRLLLTGATEADLMRRICDVAVADGGFALAWIGIGQSGEMVAQTAAAGPAIGYLEGLQMSGDPAAVHGQGVGGRALRSRRTIYCNDFDADPSMAPWAERARRHGLHSSIALPLRDEGELLGLLSLYSRDRKAFDPAEIALVEQMAADISLGIGYLRRGASLAESLQRLGQIETRIHAGSFRLLLPGGSLWCSEGAAALLGRASGFSEVSEPGGDVADADPVGALHDLATASSAGEFEFDLPVVMKAEPLHWLRVTGVIEALPEGRTQLRGLVQDVSERKALEVGITRIADTERQRIASELHDNLGQILTGTSLLVTTLEHKFAGDHHELKQDLHQVGSLLQQSLQVCRALAHGSMPDLVHGLGVALEDLARQAAAAGIHSEARIAPVARPLHGEQALELYRIAQEAVTNALKHSACHKVVIELKQHGRMVELAVIDDGTGLPPGLDPQGAAGLGQRTMRYRAARAGGTILFRSVPGGGLGVHVRVRLLGVEAAAAPRH